MRLTTPLTPPSATTRLLNERYQVLSPLRPGSSLSLALDTTTGTPYALKRLTTPQELPALRHINGLKGVATLVTTFDTAQGEYAVLELLRGESVAIYHQQQLSQSKSLAWSDVLAGAVQAAVIVAACHARGVVHGHLKPGHWFIDQAGQWHLLDFSRACLTTAVTHHERVAAEIVDFGTLLHTLATDYPYRAPFTPTPWQRPLPSRLNPHVPAAFDTLVARCWGQGETPAFTTMEEVIVALTTLTSSDMVTLPVSERFADEIDLAVLKAAIVGLGNALAHEVEAWAADPARHDLYDGASGIVRVLSVLSADFDQPQWQQATLNAAHHLAHRPMTGSAAFYHGEAAVAFALLQTAQHLNVSALRNAALERARWVATQPIQHHDLTKGAAGRVQFHLALWRATGNREMLTAAQQAGKWLLTHQKFDELGGTYWHTSTPQDPALSIGYAHGTAGVADALLALWEATGNEAYQQATVSAAQWLEHNAIAVLPESNGLQWPTTPDGPQVPYWCHGATGIAHFFLNAARLRLTDSADTIARRALNTVAQRGRALGPSLCHGVAGSLRTLLHAYIYHNNAATWRDCHTMGQVLLSYVYQEGSYAYTPAHTLGTPHPGYMTGYGGVALTLSMLYQTLITTVKEIPYVA